MNEIPETAGPHRAAFTVVELLITLLVLAVAAGTLVPLTLQVAARRADLIDRAKARQFAVNVAERLRAGAVDDTAIARIAADAEERASAAGWIIRCEAIGPPDDSGAVRVDVVVSPAGEVGSPAGEAGRFRPIRLTLRVTPESEGTDDAA